MVENFYTLSTPILFLLMALELIYCLMRKKSFIEFEDAVTSLSTGIINQFWNIWVLSFAYLVYQWIGQFAFFTIEDTPSSFIAAVLLVDFLFYWFHRAGHSFNFMWAMHSLHHTSRQLNYMMAVRTGTFQRLASILFYWPLAIIGLSPKWLVLAISFNLVMQFWQHTRVINKLPGWFESLFNTPSHHRVHHGRQSQYLNKNYGGIFIIWDKLFGTFQAEKQAPDYGTLTPVYSENPHWINIFYFHKLFVLMNQLPTWTTRFRFLIGPLSQVETFIKRYQLEYHEPEWIKSTKLTKTTRTTFALGLLFIALIQMIIATQFADQISTGIQFILFLGTCLVTQVLGNTLNARRKNRTMHRSLNSEETQIKTA